MRFVALVAGLLCCVTSPSAEPDCRAGADDPLPKFGVARLGSSRWRGLSTDGEICYTPDGDAIVCLMADGSLVWFDRDDGRELRRIRESNSARIQSFALTPDGGTAVTANDSYRFARRVLETPVPADPVVKGWNLRSGRALPLRTALTNDSRLSVVGDLVAFARSSDVSPPTFWLEVFEVATGKMRWRAPEMVSGTCVDLCLRDDGGLVAVHEQGKVTVLSNWDTRQEEVRSRFELGSSYRTYRVSPDGLTVAGFGQGSQVDRWDTRTGARITVVQTRHGARVTAVAYSVDSKVLFTGGADGAIRWWDMRSGTELGSIIPRRTAHRLAVAPAGDELAVVFAGETMVRRFALTSKSERPFPEGHRAGVALVSFAADNTVITAGADRTVRRWDRAGKLRKGFDDLGDPDLRYIAVSADGNRLIGVTGRQKVAAEGEKIEVWDIAGRPSVRTFRPEPKYFVDAALVGDGTRLLTRYTDSFADNTSRLELWDVDMGQTLWRAEGRQPGPHGDRLLVDPARQTAWGPSFDGTWNCWRISTGQRDCGMNSLTEHPTLSVDGRMLVGPERNGLFLEVIETVSGRRRLRLGRGQSRTFMWDLIPPACVPGGRLVAARDNEHPSEVVVWDLATREEVARLAGHSDKVTELAASPDGRLLASGSVDSTVVLWDLTAVGARLKSVPLPSTSGLPALWTELGDVDTEKAYRSVIALRAIGPPVLEFLRPHLKRASFDEAAVDRWIAALDAREFAAREAGEAALSATGELAGAKLRQALELSGSLEARRRVERLLRPLDGFEHSPQRLRELRAVEIIEMVGGQEARRVLADLASGHPSARLTREAAAALTRLPTH